ncbi:MAG: Gfo/Idh/MocA family protein [Armatimonadota bacterium]
MDRRTFLGQCGAVGSALAVAPAVPAAAGEAGKKIRVGVIGCGSVSGMYFPDLKKSPHVELVSACDRIPERASAAAAKYGIPSHYPRLEKMLAGAPFDLLVNLTDMQEHGHLNLQALEAGRNVWSEKPLANTVTEGQRLLETAERKKVRLWGAPAVVLSPQFAFMARTVKEGTLGKPAAAHASYGHLGPNWSAFFYQKGGGSLPDLGVYNLTTLTGILGPARSVMAMTSINTPTREIAGKGEIRVEAEDNATVLMDHGGGVFSHVQCGFNYFDPHGHEGAGQERSTISLVGTGGSMHLVGYDWAPHGVDLATADHPKPRRHVTDSQGYVWEQGASYAAKCLAAGGESLIRPEHALHVLEVIVAARESAQSGRRIPLRTRFPWPIV